MTESGSAIVPEPGESAEDFVYRVLSDSLARGRFRPGERLGG